MRREAVWLDGGCKICCGYKVDFIFLTSVDYVPDGLCIDYLLIILLSLTYTGINNACVTESKEEGDSEVV